MSMTYRLEDGSDALNMEYKPEQFPGLVIRIQRAKDICIVFQRRWRSAQASTMEQVKEKIMKIINLEKIGQDWVIR